MGIVFPVAPPEVPLPFGIFVAAAVLHLFGPVVLIHEVGADAHVVHADALGDVFDVVEHHGQVVAAAQHSGVGVDAHHAAALGDGFQRVVVLAADEVEEGLGRRVGGHDGLGGALGRFDGAPVSGVRHVHDDAGFVEPGDQIPAQFAQAPVGGFGAAVRGEVPPVVGHVHEPDAEAVPGVDPEHFLFVVLKFPEKGRTVDAPDDGGAAFLVDGGDVVGAARLGDDVPELPEQLGVEGKGDHVFGPGFSLADGLDRALQPGSLEGVAEHRGAGGIPVALVIAQVLDPLGQGVLPHVFRLDVLPLGDDLVVPAGGGQKAEVVHGEEVPVEFQTVFQLGLGGIQQRERAVPGFFLIFRKKFFHGKFSSFWIGTKSSKGGVSGQRLHRLLPGAAGAFRTSSHGRLKDFASEEKQLKRRMCHNAAKPSRQPIFLPSL